MLFSDNNNKNYTHFANIIYLRTFNAAFLHVVKTRSSKCQTVLVGRASLTVVFIFSFDFSIFLMFAVVCQSTCFGVFFLFCTSSS